MHTIIFKSNTPEGIKFDRVIIWAIVLSVITVVLETVSEFHQSFWWSFFIMEWIFTIIFTVEYIFRLYSAHQPLKYATSFFGIVDLLVDGVELKATRFTLKESASVVKKLKPPRQK